VLAKSRAYKSRRKRERRIEMKTGTTVVVVDARSRERIVFTASATTLATRPEAVILRRACEVGVVSDLIGTTVDSPILLIGEYRAMSSAGHVTVVGAEKFPPITVIGGMGFGFEVWDETSQASKTVGGALRPFARPVRGSLIPANALVANFRHSNHISNVAAEEAAFEGLKLRSRTAAWKYTLCLYEGQSDYGQVVTFTTDPTAEVPVFPEEHRSEMFTTERLVEAAVRSLGRRLKWENSREEVLRRMTNPTEEEWKRLGMDWLGQPIRDLLGDEEIMRALNALANPPTEPSLTASETDAPEKLPRRRRTPIAEEEFGPAPDEE
jgi:hypothetical protein